MDQSSVSSIITGLVRTVVPALMGQLLAWLATLGIIVEQSVVDGFTTSLVTLLGVILTGLYYVIVRLLARKFPNLELLLGSTKTPKYPN